MGSIDRQGPAADVNERSSEVAASGIRFEKDRETTPAPSSARETWASFVSAERAPRLPHDLTVPTRTGRPAPQDLDLRASFVVLHVDGRSSVADIANLTTLPAEDVLATLMALTQAGLVTFGGVASDRVPVTAGRTLR